MTYTRMRYEILVQQERVENVRGACVAMSLVKINNIISYEISNKFFCNLQPTSLSSAIREDLGSSRTKI